MDNYLLYRADPQAQELCKKLGFTKNLFIGSELTLLSAKTEKELLKAVGEAHQKKLITIYRPSSEDMLRFALEKSDVDVVLGMEQLHPKDSMHYVKSGLDQVLCKIAADNDKVIGFSFTDILENSGRAKLLARIMFNIRLCKKYKVKIIFSNFSTELWQMRSAKDLDAVFRVLSGV